MGIVEAVGAEVTNIAVGDRVVVPFNISCGHCFMCEHGLQSQCETTQVREYGTGAALFGYTKLYGQVPGGQAEFLRVPQAHYGPIKVPEGPPDDRFLFLSDVLPDRLAGGRVRRRPRRRQRRACSASGRSARCRCRIAQHRGAEHGHRRRPRPRAPGPRRVRTACRRSTSTRRRRRRRRPCAS